MLNKVILIGRLANEPELKWTPSGIPVTTFRLAVERPMSAEARQSGQQKEADFIDIVAWRQQAEFASNYLGKGRLVSIEGRLHVRQYQAADGTNRRQCEVVVEQLKSLERPREGATGGDAEPAFKPEPAAREPEQAGGGGYTRSPEPAGGYAPRAEGSGYNRPAEGNGYSRPAEGNGYTRPAETRNGSAEPSRRSASAPAASYGNTPSGRPAAPPARPAADDAADPFSDDLDDPFADN